jgi:hypothetical protein
MVTGRLSDGSTASAQHKLRICYDKNKRYEFEVGVEELGNTNLAKLSSATVAITVAERGRSGSVVVYSTNFSAKSYLETSMGQSWYPQVRLKAGSTYTATMRFSVDLALDKAGVNTTGVSYTFVA